MLKKLFVIVISLFIIILILPSCGNSDKSVKTSNDSIARNPAVSVYYLHQKKSCTTCKAVGKISKSTAEKYFQKEIFRR